MYGKNDTLLDWLFFSTNHIRGLDGMKKAMWSMDESGGFRFSDRDTLISFYCSKGSTTPASQTNCRDGSRE
jgi:hypothetical protein